MERNDRGYSLVETVITLAILSLVTTVGISSVDHARATIGLAAATSELRALFQRVRMTALTHDRNVAIRFRPDGDGWSCTVYEDGDGDGVRNDDISHGVDFVIERSHVVRYAPARIAVPANPIPDPALMSQPLYARLPVRFGPSYLCSFTREGEATNGSVVVSDGRSANVIRIQGRSAMINVLRWNGSKWIPGA